MFSLTYCIASFLERQKRIEHVASGQRLSIKEATRIVNASDKKRAMIVRKLYRRNWLAPSLYDLVMDTSKISSEKGAEMILEYVRDVMDA